MLNFWDFEAWKGVALITVLLAALFVANMLKRKIRFLHESLIPTSVLGGIILLVISSIYQAFTGSSMFDTNLFGGNGMANLEVITYHALALGFIATTFKSSGDKGGAKRRVEIFNTGVTTVATYLLQAVVGMGLTLVIALVVDGFFPAAGVLLPFGYGQGTGQALNYGTIYETDFGFVGGKSFGLTVAALGFLSASIGGVIYLNILKKKGKIQVADAENIEDLTLEEVQGKDEIPMNGAMDKLTVQIGLVFVAYLLAYGLMYVLGLILPGMKATIYGFNFLIGVLMATLVKFVLGLFKKSKVMHRQYVSNFMMTRISNFCFDVMVVAGIAAIRIEMVKDYWWILLLLGVVGLTITYFYNSFIARKFFPEYEHEQFLAMYGMLTGTASTGIILLRELDPHFKTPVADNLVYQNFPAIVFGFPMMLLATLAPKQPYLTYIILVAFFIMMNVILFRRQIFLKNKTK